MNILPCRSMPSLQHIRRFVNQLFKCKDGGGPLEEYMLKLMQRQSRIVMQYSKKQLSFQVQRPGDSASSSRKSFHTIRTVLKKELKWHAWKPHYCQSLSAEDCNIHMEFGEIMLARYEDWPDLFQNILWTDEVVFHIGGFVNHHNCYYWAGEDTLVTSEKCSWPKVMVWCGMISDRTVGPLILHDTMNAERYLTMLQDEIWPVISAWESIEYLIFMQDGTPRHFALVVHEWLEDRWVIVVCMSGQPGIPT